MSLVRARAAFEERFHLAALIAAAGLAVGAAAFWVATPAAIAQDKGEPPAAPPASPQPAPAAEPAADPERKESPEEEKARLLKFLQENKPAEEPKPAPPVITPPPQTPPKPAVIQAPVVTPPGAPGAKAAPAAQPAAAGAAQPATGGAPMLGGTGGPLPKPEEAIQGANFVFDFVGETDITLIVDYVQQSLGLQMIIQDGAALVGQKVEFKTPLTVPVEKAISFLTFVLEQRDYTIVKNEFDIYMVLPRNQMAAVVGDDPNNSTRIIPTPGLKPSSLQGPLSALIASSRGGAAGGQPIFMDDLGVIVLTDSPRVSAVVETFVAKLVAEQKKIGITRFPVNQIAAAAARDRILELLGSGVQSRGLGGVPVAPGAALGALGGSITNLPDRLTIDPVTNALLFRGRPDETQLLATLLPLVDAPNQLESRWYPIGGKATEIVTDAASREQLGDVTYFESSESTGSSGAVFSQRGQRGGAQGIAQPGGVPGFGGGAETSAVGSGFVVYPEAGGFMYRGTNQQHARVNALIQKLGPLSEFTDDPVYAFYKLKHSKAEDVANVINDLITNQTSGNRGGLLGRDLGGADRRNRPASATERTRDLQRRLAGESDPNAGVNPAAGGGIGAITSEDVFVLADEQNNQVVVKAPPRVQSQMKDLIDRLDLRRPQVYIEAKVVAITVGDDFRLTAEVQQIIGQFALSTNFGLSSVGDTGNILTRKNVAPGEGITTALIRSKDVPFIINALARDTDARVVASPQVLVDDNQEAEIESKDAQPTLTTSIGSAGQQNTQSFGGFEEAGPKLTVKPQISEGGYLRLEYEIELSSFTGEGSNGTPPPKQTNRLKSESVTVPSDTTIVVGGLAQEFQSKNVSGIPLLKDIPLLGELFKDTRLQKRNITLYVFITPKIMRDPSFADLRLITRKPIIDAKLDAELPRPEPERIDLTDSAALDTELRQEEAIKDQKVKYDPDPAPTNKKYKRRNQGMAD